MSQKQRKHHNDNGSVIRGTISGYHPVVMSSGNGSLTIDDLVSDVTADLGLVYRYYRFTRIKVTVVGSQNSGIHTIAYAPPQANLSSYTLMESAFLMVYNAAVMTIPMSFTVPWKFLQGLGNWLVTQQDANSNVDFEAVGSILCSNVLTATASVYLKLEIDYEFRDPLNSATLQQRKAYRDAVREKRKRVEESPFRQDGTKPSCLCVEIAGTPSNSNH